MDRELPVSTALPRNRLLVLVTAIALVACAAVYSAHGLGDRNHEHSHCDLCVHFSGSAGSPAKATLASKPVPTDRVAPAPPELFIPTRSATGEHLPRGPPV
jgi:hypothetical protein